MSAKDPRRGWAETSGNAKPLWNRRLFPPNTPVIRPKTPSFVELREKQDFSGIKRILYQNPCNPGNSV
jgi:hypothetical protein